MHVTLADHEAVVAEKSDLFRRAKEAADGLLSQVEHLEAENQRLREAVKFVSNWMESGNSKGRPMDRMTNKQWEKWLELKDGAG